MSLFLIHYLVDIEKEGRSVVSNVEKSICSNSTWIYRTDSSYFLMYDILLVFHDSYYF